MQHESEGEVQPRKLLRMLVGCLLRGLARRARENAERL